MRAHDQEGVCKGLCTLARVLSAWILCCGRRRIEGALVRGFSFFICRSGDLFFNCLPVHFLPVAVSAHFLLTGGELCCVSVLPSSGGRSTECKSLLGCVGMLRGNCVLGFSVLSKWLQTPRLETRTKESNMCASVVELRILWRAMKVRDAKRRGSNPCCLQLHRPIWILRTLLCVQLERFAF